MKKSLVLIFGLVALLTLSTAAFAADVPGSLIVHRAGAEFAYASPCDAFAPSCGGDLVMHDGWRVAIDSEFLGAFSGLSDLYAAFDGGAKCASAYFSSGWSHCDGGDILAGYVYNQPASWLPHEIYGPCNCKESFVIRGAVVGAPEPSSLALLGVGLLAMYGTRRRLAASAKK